MTYVNADRQRLDAPADAPAESQPEASDEA